MNTDSPESIAKHIDEYHKVELEEIFTRNRAFVALRVQIFSFIGTAHLTILGIAFTTQKAILIIIAACLMIILRIVDSVLTPIIDVLIARSLQIEKKYSTDKEALCISIVSVLIEKKFNQRNTLDKIRVANTQNEIIRLIKSRTANQIGIWLPITIMSCEFIGVLIIWKYDLLPLF